MSLKFYFVSSKCEDVLECPQYYRGVLTYACGGSAVLGILSLSITKLTAKNKPDKHNKDTPL